MIEPPKTGNARINLRGAAVLCADDSTHGLEILSQILLGFGAGAILRATTAEEFRAMVPMQACDLILVNAAISDNQGFELVRWMRTLNQEPQRFTPTIILSGYTVRSQVAAARDCGANFVVSKPVSAATLLDRINWIARNKRLFIESDGYVGPDRRFKQEGVPEGIDGRRRTDLVGAIGAAVQPNLSQDAVETLVKPQKVAL